MKYFMRHTFIFLILVLYSNIFSQSANSYFPENQGYVWRYKVIPLDTLNNPIDSLVTFRVDSFATSSFIHNKDSKITLSKSGTDPFLFEEPYSDTILYSFEQNTGYEYLGMNQLGLLIDFISQFVQDSTGGVANFFKSFEGWKSNYRFTNAVNAQYTILQRDTTFIIDTLVLPLRFQILGKRFNDQELTTDIGSFNCKKFSLEWRLSYLVTFPPPIPPLAVKILGIVDTLWIAPQNWIVKSFIPSTVIDLSLIGFGSFTIPGVKRDIHNPPLSVNDHSLFASDFKLNQNYPNPFNPSTRISWQSSVDGWQSLKVYDILGNEIAVLVDEYRKAGYYEVEFPNKEMMNISSLPSGVYLYKLQIGNVSQVKKMIIIK